MDREVELREFVSARGAALSRAAYLLTGDHQAAEDLVQETYVVLVRRWQRSGTVDPEAYVRRIIVRTNIDEHRRPWRRERSGLDGHDRAVVDGSGIEERSELFDALQQLPVAQRRVVVLRHWLGLSVEETAAELGISTGTVKSASSRAREKLRDLLTAVDVLATLSLAGSVPGRPGLRDRDLAASDALAMLSP